MPARAQDAAVDAIGALAKATLGDAFAQHAPALLRALVARIGALAQPADVPSRAKAIEAAGAVAAASLSCALTDGYALLESLVQLLGTLPAGADGVDAELVKATHGAWAHVARAVGADFEPRLLAALLPRLLAGASTAIEVNTHELTDDEAAEHEEALEHGGGEEEDDDDDTGDGGCGWLTQVIKSPSGAPLLQQQPSFAAARACARRAWPLPCMRAVRPAGPAALPAAPTARWR